MGTLNVTQSTEDAFSNNNVGGSQFLPVGVHKNVLITEANDVVFEKGSKSYQALQLVLEAESGKQAKTTLFYIESIFENGKNTGKTQLSRKLRGLTGALIKDESLRKEVFNSCVADTSLFEKLVGFRCNIEIAYPKKGYVILRNPDSEEIGIYDLGNDSELVKSFENFTDAVDYMKEEGLRRAYTEVVAFSRTLTDSGDDINAKCIQDFIKTATGTAKGKGNVAPLNKRAGGTSM